MTVNELIQRLQEMGDEKWRSTAEVRIRAANGEELADDIDAFDVKYDVRWCDININYHDGRMCMDDWDDWDDWDDVDEEDDWEDEDDDAEEESQNPD